MNLDWIAVAGVVQQIAEGRSGGAVEEGEGKDVPARSLPHQWRSFSVGHVSQVKILHLLQGAPSGKPLLEAWKLKGQWTKMERNIMQLRVLNRCWRPWFTAMVIFSTTTRNCKRPWFGYTFTPTFQNSTRWSAGAHWGTHTVGPPKRARKKVLEARRG